MRFNQNKNTTTLKIVPFRETKLTRLFQSYLMGRSELGYEGKLTMIVNISQVCCHVIPNSDNIVCTATIDLSKQRW